MMTIRCDIMHSELALLPQSKCPMFMLPHSLGCLP